MGDGRVHLSRLRMPLTPDELLVDINDLFKQIKERYESDTIDHSDLDTIVFLIEFLIRYKHITKEMNIKNSDYCIESHQKWILDYLLNNTKIFSMLLNDLEKRVKRYSDLCESLAMDGIETWEGEEFNLLSIRDKIQGEIEIFNLLSNDISHLQPSIEKADSLWKSIDHLLIENKFPMISENKKNVYPFRIYWWRYLGVEK